MAVVLIVAMIALGLVIAGKKFNIGPFAPTATPTPAPTPRGPTPTPDLSQAVILIDYGRFTLPVEAIHVDAPSGALILYVDTGAVDYGVALESVDDEAHQVAGPGDEWVYYYDTLPDGTLYFGIRCRVSDLDLPVRERRCQTSQFQLGQVHMDFLYENGFVSSRE